MGKFKKFLNIAGFYCAIFLLLALFKTAKSDVALGLLIIAIFTMIFYKDKLMYYREIKMEDKKHGNSKPDKRIRAKSRKV